MYAPMYAHFRTFVCAFRISFNYLTQGEFSTTMRENFIY